MCFHVLLYVKKVVQSLKCLQRELYEVLWIASCDVTWGWWLQDHNLKPKYEDVEFLGISYLCSPLLISAWGLQLHLPLPHMTLKGLSCIVGSGGTMFWQVSKTNEIKKTCISFDVFNNPTVCTGYWRSRLMGMEEDELMNTLLFWHWMYWE